MTAVDPANVGYAKVAFSGSGVFTLGAGNGLLASPASPPVRRVAAGTSATFQVGPEARHHRRHRSSAVNTAGLGIGGLDL